MARINKELQFFKKSFLYLFGILIVISAIPYYILRISFSFVGSKPNLRLSEKEFADFWWYRLLKIIYIAAILLLFFVSLTIIIAGVAESFWPYEFMSIDGAKFMGLLIFGVLIDAISIFIAFGLIRKVFFYILVGTTHNDSITSSTQ